MLSITYDPAVAPRRLPCEVAASHVYRGGAEQGGRKVRLLVAAGVSLGLHAVLLCWHLLWPEPPVKLARSVEKVEVIQISMPVIEPEVEPTEIQEAFGEESADLIAPPMLADVPSVKVNVFTQPITVAPQTINVGAGTRIPVGRPGNPLGKGMGVVFDVANVDQAPAVRSHVPPDYPLEMRRSGIRGSVTVEFVVDQQGVVYSVQVVSSSHVTFERPAVAAVQRWKFRPGRMNGRTVNTRVRQVINFNMEKD